MTLVKRASAKSRGDRRVRSDHALDRRMRDIALVPERDVLHRGNRHAAHKPREAGQILGQHRIALMRHAEEPSARGKIFFRLENLRALKMTDFDREPFDRRRHDGERRKKRRVAVARNDLRRDRLDGQSHLMRHMVFDARINIGESADGARNRAGRNFLSRFNEPRARAGEFGVSLRQFSPNVVGSA